MQPYGDDLDPIGEVHHAAILWRRIIPQWIKFHDDGTEFIASAAFRDNLDGNISVHIAALTTAEAVRRNFPFCRLAEIEARVVKERGFSVIPDPLPDDPSHAILRPTQDHKSKSKKSRIEDARIMARTARLL